MSERKHTDLWRELVDEAGEDEVDRAATVSVPQAEAELKAAGFDVAAERAKASAFVDATEGTRRKGSRGRVVWLAAAASLAAVGGTLVATLHPSPELVGSPRPPTSSRPAPVVPSANDLAIAAELRRKAAVACDAKQWSVCLASLDDARAVDPGGDDALTVKSLRDKAIAGNRDGG
jgi:hypothetical protein